MALTNQKLRLAAFDQSEAELKCACALFFMKDNKIFEGIRVIVGGVGIRTFTEMDKNFMSQMVRAHQKIHIS